MVEGGHPDGPAFSFFAPATCEFCHPNCDAPSQIPDAFISDPLCNPQLAEGSMDFGLA